MIVLLIIILLMSIASSTCCLICWFDIKKKNDTIIKNANSVNELYQEISDLRKDITTLKSNPAEFTKRFSVVDIRLNKMENILSTFNNGFKYQDSWMR